MRARAHRLLADVQVAEAADLAERVGLGAALLEPALQEHRAQQLEVELARRTCCGAAVVSDFASFRSGWRSWMRAGGEW